jgi:hypothetical protein
VGVVVDLGAPLIDIPVPVRCESDRQQVVQRGSRLAGRALYLPCVDVDAVVVRGV